MYFTAHCIIKSLSEFLFRLLLCTCSPASLLVRPATLCSAPSFLIRPQSHVQLLRSCLGMQLRVQHLHSRLDHNHMSAASLLLTNATTSSVPSFLIRPQSHVQQFQSCSKLQLLVQHFHSWLDHNHMFSSFTHVEDYNYLFSTFILV